MNDNNVFPEVDYTRRSICDSGKLSYGKALFRSVLSVTGFLSLCSTMKQIQAFF